MSVSANFIGAGKVGKTLAHLLQKKGFIQIDSVCNQSLDSAQRAIQFIRAGVCVEHMQDLPPADITFITTPDATIQGMCEALTQHGVLKPGSVVLHCSGVLSSDVLASARTVGCLPASVHPMRSFADPAKSLAEYAGTYCTIEGDTDAVTKLSELFQGIASLIVPIDKTKKPLYHAAGVFASNYLVTLAQAAQWCLCEAGIAKATASEMTSALMQGTLSNLASMSSSEALTGPLKRGDVSTVQSHLEALIETPFKSIYALLGQSTLPWIELPLEKKEILERIFSTQKKN